MISHRPLLLVLDDEARIRRHRETGPERRDQLFHSRPLVLVQRHVFDRFRKGDDGDERNRDRHDTADLEQDRPAVVWNEGRADQPGEGAAQRHAPHGDDRQRRPQVPRRRFGADRHHIGNDAADAQTGDQPQPKELRQIDRISGREGEYAKQQVGGDQSGLAAIAIADPAENGGAEQHADVAGAEHRPERAARNAPGRDQMRRREGDRTDVVAVDQGEQNGPGQQSDLE